MTLKNKRNICKQLASNQKELTAKIHELSASCDFDLLSFYNENTELVKKYLRKNTYKLEIKDFNPEDIPDSWYYKNKEGLLKNGIKNKEYTIYQKLDWIKCGIDIVYFTKKNIKIISIDDGIIPFNLYDYQEDLLELYSNNRFCASLQCRQSGKTQTTAAFILHYGIFTSAKFTAILANKADQAQEILERIQLSYELLPMYLQGGLKTYNKRSMKFGNDSKIQTFASGSSAVRGKSIACLYIDEAAFIPRDMEFYESTYPTIASGKNSKIILTTTPNGTRGMFYKLWKESVAGLNSFVRMTVDWKMVPGRDEAWKNETISNTSKEQFRQEHELHFRGSANSLISGDVLEGLPKKNILSKIEDLKIYEEPKEDHIYAMTVDCSEGIGQDYHAFSVIDISSIPYNVVCVYENNTLSHLALPVILHNVASKYNNACVLLENMSTGGEVGNDLYYDLEYENVLMTRTEKGKQVVGFSADSRIGVKMSKSVKSIGCSVAKTIIENNKIQLNDEELINQFGDFVAKGSSYEAAEGSNDDMVMTIVIFAWLSTQEFFIDLTSSSIKRSISEDIIVRSVEDMIPFGIIDNGITEFDGQKTIDMDDEYYFMYNSDLMN